MKKDLKNYLQFLNESVKNGASSSKYDKLLLDYAKRIVNTHKHILNYACENRGALVEILITLQPKDNGAHGLSTGDMRYNGKPTEIKYITTKTGAHGEMQGSICKQYLMIYNDGRNLWAELTQASKTTIKNGRYTLKENVNKGVRVEL